jgi:hypothetical protein
MPDGFFGPCDPLPVEVLVGASLDDPSRHGRFEAGMEHRVIQPDATARLLGL